MPGGNIKSLIGWNGKNSNIIAEIFGMVRTVVFVVVNDDDDADSDDDDDNDDDDDDDGDNYWDVHPCLVPDDAEVNVNCHRELLGVNLPRKILKEEYFDQKNILIRKILKEENFDQIQEGALSVTIHHPPSSDYIFLQFLFLS